MALCTIYWGHWILCPSLGPAVGLSGSVCWEQWHCQFRGCTCICCILQPALQVCSTIHIQPQLVQCWSHAVPSVSCVQEEGRENSAMSGVALCESAARQAQNEAVRCLCRVALVAAPVLLPQRTAPTPPTNPASHNVHTPKLCSIRPGYPAHSLCFTKPPPAPLQHSAPVRSMAGCGAAEQQQGRDVSHPHSRHVVHPPLEHTRPQNQGGHPNSPPATLRARLEGWGSAACRTHRPQNTVGTT